MTSRKKLIEVALPLDAINKAESGENASNEEGGVSRLETHLGGTR